MLELVEAPPVVDCCSVVEWVVVSALSLKVRLDFKKFFVKLVSKSLIDRARKNICAGIE